MLKLAYVSNLSADILSGGFSGMNVAMFDALKGQYEVTYVGPVQPRPSRAEHLVSKLRRSMGRRGKFFFFSPRRLSRIAAQVAVRLEQSSVEQTFFHGFTPWIAYRCPTPYFAWSDCTFRDYINIYHQRENFEAADLRRIEDQEIDWLQRAQKVLFTSRWAMEGAIRDYGLNPAKLAVVGVPITQATPKQDAYADSRDFAFISTDFKAKGGLVVVDALDLVRRKHQEVRLIVVGDLPPKSIQQREGVTCIGFLHREIPSERSQWQQVFATVRALVHPTRADIAPLLFSEAASFGCPVIASRRFAIPEIVDDGKTGLLLDNSDSPVAVAAAIEQMLDLAENDYLAMRRQARHRASDLFTPQRFQQRVAAALL